VEAARYVLNRVAKRLVSELSLSPVTDDFVVYGFDDRFDTGLYEDIRFAAPPAAVRSLEAKGLLE
jgi:hypothetical protein